MQVDPHDHIGSKAGAVWTALQDEPKTVKQLTEATDLNRREVSFALGWLAREDKLAIDKPGRYYRYALVED